MVDLTVADGIAWLTLKRPEVLNALDLASVRQFAAHVTALRERPDVRVVVTRGEGRAYCVGSDLRELAPLSPAAATAAEREHAAAFSLLETLPQPTVATLHGYVLGGGLGLALYHDFRIAAVTAVLGLPEVEMGWTPPWALGRLVDTVGGARAHWLTMTGARLAGSEARALGLVDDAVPDDQLAGRVDTLARKLAATPPAALHETKALLNRMAPLRRSEWDDAAAAAFERCYATAEAQANVAAFLARRQR